MARKKRGGPSIGKRIAAWRRRSGRNQVELAAQMGIYPSSISRWESGESDPSHKNLARMAAVLGIDLATFFGPLNGDDVAAA